MRSSQKITSIIGAALMASAFAGPSISSAADLLMDPPIVEAPEVHRAGGWYLRGDISYNTFEFESNPMYHVENGGGYRSFDSADLDDSYGVGIGLGYQINEYFRVDATLDYLSELDFKGSTSSAVPCSFAAGGTTTCVSDDSTTYTATRLMANAYVDLGNYSGFTPYVGAGLGGAYVESDGLKNVENCVPSAANACPNPGSATTNHGGVSDWRFAWALHAGASYDITHNLKVDVGYSYNHIEGGPMFNWTNDALGRSGLAGGPQGFDKDITSHTIRAGLRYQIW